MNKLKSLIQKPNFQALLLFLFLFFIYLSRTPSDIVGYGWSDDFIRSGVTGSALKAPQFFILQTIIGFSNYLLPNISPKSVGYGLASLLGAGTVALLYVLLSKVESLKKFPYKKPRVLYKLVSVLTLAFSYYFFTQSLVIERYALVAFLLVLLMNLSLMIRKDDSRKAKYLFSAVLAFGIMYHFIFLLFGLVSLVFWIKRDGIKNIINNNQIYFVIGLLAAIFVLILNKNNYSPSIKYSHIREGSISSIISLYKENYLTDGYGGEMKLDKSAIKLFASNSTDALLVSLGYASLVLSVFGVFVVMGIQKTKAVSELLWMFLLLWLGSLIVSGLGNVGGNINSYILSIIVPQIFLSGFAWMSLLEFDRRFTLVGKLLESKSFSKIMTVLLLVLSSYYFVLNFNNSSFEGVNVGIVSRETLEALEEESYIICFKDDLCSSLLYSQSVEGIRKDVTIIPYWYHPQVMALDLSDIRPFKYNTHPSILFEIVSEILSDKESTLYSIGVSKNYWDYFGFDKGFIHYIPLGYYGELSILTDDELPIPSYPHLTFSSSSKVRDILKTSHASSLIQNRVLNGIIYFKSGKINRGYYELDEASKIAHTLNPVDFQSFLTSKNSAEGHTKDYFFENSNKLESINFIRDEANNYLESELSGMAIKLIRGAMLMKPYDEEIRIQAGDIYKESGAIEHAIIEYKNALKINGNNKEAQDRLIELLNN